MRIKLLYCIILMSKKTTNFVWKRKQKQKKIIGSQRPQKINNKKQQTAKL